MGDVGSLLEARIRLQRQLNRVDRRSPDAIEQLLNAEDALSFRDAADTLAREQGEGLDWLPEKIAAVDAEDLSPLTTQEALDELQEESLHAARQYFAGNIREPRAQAVLTKKGLHPETIADWDIGYALPGPAECTLALLHDGFPLRTLVSSGITTVGRQYQESWSSVRDRFRDRVIFPEQDEAGNPTGFSGRTCEAGREPKFLKTPTDSVLGPTRMPRAALYNTYRAKPAIVKEGEAYLAEGYWEPITLAQIGIANAVSSSGTSFGRDKARQFAALTKQAVILYDGDIRGYHAALKAHDRLRDQRVAVSFIVLPLGSDLDDYLLTQADPRTAFATLPRVTHADFARMTFGRGQIASLPLRERMEVVRDIAAGIASEYEWSECPLRIHEYASILDVPAQALEVEILEPLARARESDATHGASPPDDLFFEYLAGLPTLDAEQRTRIQETLTDERLRLTPEQASLYFIVRDALGGADADPDIHQSTLFRDPAQNSYAQVVDSVRRIAGIVPPGLRLAFAARPNSRRTQQIAELLRKGSDTA